MGRRSGKKFWDFVDLLIVPRALAIGAAWLNWAQRERERQAEEAEKQREIEIQNERSQDCALQAYLDQLTQLLLRACYELGRRSHRNADSTVGLVPS